MRSRSALTSSFEGCHHDALDGDSKVNRQLRQWIAMTSNLDSLRDTCLYHREREAPYRNYLGDLLLN